MPYCGKYMFCARQPSQGLGRANTRKGLPTSKPGQLWEETHEKKNQLTRSTPRGKAWFYQKHLSLTILSPFFRSFATFSWKRDQSSKRNFKERNASNSYKIAEMTKRICCNTNDLKLISSNLSEFQPFFTSDTHLAYCIVLYCIVVQLAWSSSF